MISAIDWQALDEVATTASDRDQGPGALSEREWDHVRHALTSFVANDEFASMIRLRLAFDELYTRDSATGLTILQELDNRAISAARALNERSLLGRLLDTRGHNLHRQGIISVLSRALPRQPISIGGKEGPLRPCRASA